MSRPVVADPSSPSELQTSKPCEVGVPSVVQARLRQTRAYRCVPPSYRARSPSSDKKYPHPSQLLTNATQGLPRRNLTENFPTHSNVRDSARFAPLPQQITDAFCALTYCRRR